MTKLEQAIKNLTLAALDLENVIASDVHQEWIDQGKLSTFHNFLISRIRLNRGFMPGTLLQAMVIDAVVKAYRPKQKRKPEPVRSLPFTGRSGGAA